MISQSAAPKQAPLHYLIRRRPSGQILDLPLQFLELVADRIIRADLPAQFRQSVSQRYNGGGIGRPFLLVCAQRHHVALDFQDRRNAPAFVLIVPFAERGIGRLRQIIGLDQIDLFLNEIDPHRQRDELFVGAAVEYTVETGRQ